nr:hypothetical protein [Tanacetum cinerariifolium]
MLSKSSQIVNRLYAFIYETNHSKSELGLPSIVALVMVIDDKSWTLLERHERAFYIGLEKFVDHCKPLVNSAGKIRCPCKSCRIILWVSIKHLSDHIMRHGFDLALLNDLSYIPLNNEHNEPTEGDIYETSNEPNQATRNEFEKLYASANEELYPGCDYVTRLDFMAKFTYFKVKGYKLPPSYYAIKKIFKMIGLGYELIHACKHDSCLFRGKENKDLDFCPIIPRLQRLYKSSHTTKEMIWHATGKCTEPGKMQHPVDGRAWKKFDTMYSNFAKEPRNVRLGLAADESSFMLTLLIPGPKSSGKDIDVYLRHLIEDLKVLWDRKGVETIDVASGQKFNMRAMQYLPDKIAKPIIELCSLFKQICSATLMEDEMLKAQIKVVDILCDLELMYPHVLFDIMIHLVIHLPLEALEGGPIHPRLFPNKDMKKEFPDWFGSQICQRHVDNDKDPKVSTTSDLFALACGLTWTSISVNSCVVDGVRGVIVVEDDLDIIHFDNSSDLPLSTSLNDLDNATLHIDGQSTEVDALLDIIDVPDEDDDIIDDKDAIPYDLADFDDEDLINVVDDGVDKMSVDVARSHSGDGGGEDRPPPHHVPTGCKGKRKPNLGGRAAGRLHTRDKTRNLSLKEITDKKGRVPIRFEVIRGVPLYYPSLLKDPKERKAALITDIGTQFDLRPHMESPDWTEIDVDIQQHL